MHFAAVQLTKPSRFLFDELCESVTHRRPLIDA